ncbi:MAG: ChbG/HpnK family deacetylase, partial [Antricoccus sp.]
TVVGRGLIRRIDPADVRREFAAQLERVIRIGVPVTHLDTHQHVHLWPSIGKVVAQLAVSRGIPAVRVPRSRRKHPIRIGVNLLSAQLRRQVARAGLRTTGDYAGLDEAGSFFGATFIQTLQNLADVPDAVLAVEINAHPGEVDDELHRFDWGYHWAEELGQLTDPDTRALIERLGFRTAPFPALSTPLT